MTSISDPPPDLSPPHLSTEICMPHITNRPLSNPIILHHQPRSAHELSRPNESVPILYLQSPQSTIATTTPIGAVPGAFKQLSSMTPTVVVGSNSNNAAGVNHPVIIQTKALTINNNSTQSTQQPFTYITMLKPTSAPPTPTISVATLSLAVPKRGRPEKKFVFATTHAQQLPMPLPIATNRGAVTATTNSIQSAKFALLPISPVASAAATTPSKVINLKISEGGQLVPASPPDERHHRNGLITLSNAASQLQFAEDMELESTGDNDRSYQLAIADASPTKMQPTVLHGGVSILKKFGSRPRSPVDMMICKSPPPKRPNYRSLLKTITTISDANTKHVTISSTGHSSAPSLDQIEHSTSVATAAITPSKAEILSIDDITPNIIYKCQNNNATQRSATATQHPVIVVSNSGSEMNILSSSPSMAVVPSSTMAIRPPTERRRKAHVHVRPEFHEEIAHAIIEPLHRMPDPVNHQRFATKKHYGREFECEDDRRRKAHRLSTEKVKERKEAEKEKVADVDVLKVLNWENDIGSLPGSNLKFQLNEFGFLEYLSKYEYRKITNKRRDVDIMNPNLDRTNDAPVVCAHCGAYDAYVNSKYCSVHCESAAAIDSDIASKFRTTPSSASTSPPPPGIATGIENIPTGAGIHNKNNGKVNGMNGGTQQQQQPLFGKRKRKSKIMLGEIIGANSQPSQDCKATVETILAEKAMDKPNTITTSSIGAATSRAQSPHTVSASTAGADAEDTPVNSDEDGDNSRDQFQYPWNCSKKGFSWVKYLSHTGSQRAPVRLFKDPFPYHRNGFRTNMKLEGIDPHHPSQFCVLTVAEVRGYRIRLHFDGFPSTYDYWLNADSLDIFPAGYCEKHNYKLVPPPNYTEKTFNWSNYLRDTKSIAAFKQIMVNRPQFLPTNFRTGMKLEAVDKRNSNLVCVATVANIMDNRILIHFDSWDDIYDYWVEPSSPYIHPVGWCDQEGHDLIAPNGYPSPETFTWDRYLQETKSQTAPVRAFKQRPPNGFKRSMKVECVDRRNARLIRVAAIADVDEHRVQIRFDGWPNKYNFWIDCDSPDLHPVGWCKKTGHPIEPPLTPDDVYDFLECQTVGCKGIGSTEGPHLLTHSSIMHCPYSDENLDKEWPLPDRLQGTSTHVERALPISKTPPKDTRTELKIKQEEAPAAKAKLKFEQPEPKSSSSSVADEQPSSSATLRYAKQQKRRYRKKRISPAIVPVSDDDDDDDDEDEKPLRVMATSLPVPLTTSKPVDVPVATVHAPTPAATSTPTAANQSAPVLSPSSAAPRPQPKASLSAQQIRDLVSSDKPSTEEVHLWRRYSQDLHTLVKQHTNPRRWSARDVLKFVASIPQCHDQQRAFARHSIDGPSLLMLSQTDLVDILHMKIGPAIKLYNCILLLRKRFPSCT